MKIAGQFKFCSVLSVEQSQRSNVLMELEGGVTALMGMGCPWGDEDVFELDSGDSWTTW